LFTRAVPVSDGIVCAVCYGSVPGDSRLYRDIMHKLQRRSLCCIDRVIELCVMPRWDEVRCLKIAISLYSCH
jgi:hypothetical protein